METSARTFALVFCTAHAEHALKAFETAALDYIVKPAPPKRVKEALLRGIAAVRGEWTTRFEGSALNAPLAKPTLRDIRGYFWIEAHDVAYIVSENHETIAYSVERREGFSDMSLSTLERRLDPLRFFRCHRSTIVNVEQISRFDPKQSTVTVSLRTVDVSLPLARRSRAALKERLTGTRS